MIASVYLQSVLRRFTEYKGLGDKTLARLTEAQLHTAPDKESNSIAVIIRHLHGNMLSRWTNFLTEDGEKEWRSRDTEFDDPAGSREELIALWEEGWGVLLDTLRGLKPEDLERTITIRNEPLPAVDAINRQLMHYGYHTGQIVYLGKWMLSQNWETLSIPRNGSAEFNRQMKEQHGS